MRKKIAMTPPKFHGPTISNLGDQSGQTNRQTNKQTDNAIYIQCRCRYVLHGYSAAQLPMFASDDLKNTNKGKQPNGRLG